MKNTITIITCVMFLLLNSPVFAKEKLAVMDLEGNGVKDYVVFGLSDFLRDAIHEQDDYEVLSREDLEALAKRASIQQQAGECTDDQCLADLGKALGTKYMVYGTIAKLGSTYAISLRLLDTEGKDAGVKNRVSERCKCSEDDLFNVVQAAADKIMGKESSGQVTIKQNTSSKPRPTSKPVNILSPNRDFRVKELRDLWESFMTSKQSTKSASQRKELINGYIQQLTDLAIDLRIYKKDVAGVNEVRKEIRRVKKELESL